MDHQEHEFWRQTRLGDRDLESSAFGRYLKLRLDEITYPGLGARKETDKGQLEKKKENKYGVMEIKSRKCFKRRK